MASRYSGFGSSGSRPRSGARAAIKANRAASTISRGSRKARRTRTSNTSTLKNAVGGAVGSSFDRVG